MAISEGREARSTPSTPLGTIVPWAISLLISAAVVLPIELGRHHYSSHKTSIRVIAALLIWVAIAALIRFLVFIFDRIRTR